MQNQMPPVGLSKKLQPQRVVLGLGVIVLGVAVTAGAILYFLSGNTTKLFTFAIGPILVACGVGAIFSANAQVCSTCDETLGATYMSFPIELDALVRNAIREAEHGVSASLVALQGAPLPHNSAPLFSSLEVRHCPQCRAVAQMSAGHRRLQNGYTALEAELARVVVRGPMVAMVLDAIHRRNRAYEIATYGGPLT